jgi:hypothetical membrane protein
VGLYFSLLKIPLMTSFIKLAFLIFLSNTVQAQEKLPVLKATDKIVKIKIDGELRKDDWYLVPETNPDIFTIGSKWVYKDKLVSFITNKDSISFKVNAGQQFNFIILLNDSIPCYTQIYALPNPAIWASSILISISIAIGIMGIFIYKKRKLLYKKLHYLGIAITVLFWITTFVSGFIHGSYNHFKNTISELGAIDTKAELFTGVALIIIVFLCVLFTIALYQKLKQLQLSTIPALLTISMPMGILGAAFFPLGNEFHSMLGFLPLLLLFACSFSIFLWRGATFKKIRLLCFISLLLMCGIFLRFNTSFNTQYEGLVQRFFYFGWSVWCMGLGIGLRGLEK